MRRTATGPIDDGESERLARSARGDLEGALDEGTWVTQGGFDHPVVLFVLRAVIGLRGVTEYSVDEMLGLVQSAPLAFAAALLTGALLAAISGSPVPMGRA